ncbi:hypothetical protein TrispH2_003058 [Trichoplax sp. H2]|uniref:ADP-ribosyl cyclase/cyclic ADP-ribose hydrolase n=1 Tax=Trichoplax adhaerens TaxID=10228 RepID=B3RNE1_TRIAD|nr:hypothetical protein TRIADDRAFT_53133 [Trichoplax adhaerens]EDV27437.1 hypothetical protein TRIADDRAFT_53133 [Trichoplax adhaerens]RDD44385.1 hypothetical protein TrispH2_003058 [Trichoplax sp. H2]|eukprot:XP_002109271.1 hypothetical protein TRIADDRAFT_53133 [Trichoplax adhaerens]
MAEERLKKQLFDGIRNNDLYSIQKALNNGAKIDMTLSHSDKKAADYAIELGKEDAVMLLIANGAKPDMNKYQQMLHYFLDKLAINRLKDIKEALTAIANYVKQKVFRVVFYESCLQDNLLDKLFNILTLYTDSCGADIFSVLAYATKDTDICAFIRPLKYFDKIFFYATCKDFAKEMRIPAILAIVNLSIDEETEIKLVNGNIVEILTLLLTESHTVPFFTSVSEQNESILRALCDLSVGEIALKHFEEAGIVNLLLNTLQSEQSSIKVKESAVKILWNYLFHDSVKLQVQRTTVINILQQVEEKFADYVVSGCLEGALWLLGAPVDIEPYIPLTILAKNLESGASDGLISHSSQFQIWISYHQNDLAIAIKIRSYLKYAGFRAFIDIDRNTNVKNEFNLKSIAKNIDESNIVVVCLSHKYKQSPYCHSQAHFAVQKKKKVIPILLQANYNLHGWLGDLFGSIPILDFSDGNDIDNNMKSLKQEVIRSSGDRDQLYKNYAVSNSSSLNRWDSDSSLPREYSESVITNDVSERSTFMLTPSSSLSTVTAVDDVRLNYTNKLSKLGSVYPNDRSFRVSSATSSARNYIDWNVENVGLWLNSIGLGSYREMFRNQQVCGSSLEQLLRISLDPIHIEYLHRLLESKLGIVKFGDVLKFITELQKLSSR